LSLHQVGAGIQIPSNSSRILLKWGLGPFLGDKVGEPEGMSFRRWQDGKKIAYTKLVPDFRDNFDAPYYVVHRAHFHDAMHRLALELGVTVLVNSRVDSYDAEMATVQVTNGKSYTGDLVIAADGEELFLCNYELLTRHRSKILRSARNTKGA
jgi:salicylate hydroxylase